LEATIKRGGEYKEDSREHVHDEVDLENKEDLVCKEDSRKNVQGASIKKIT
jgi:hypothetical protein